MVVGFLHLVTNHGIVATTQARRELQVHGRIVNLVDLDNLHFLQLTQTLLHLYGLCRLIAETLYKVANIGHLLLLILVGPQLLFAAFFPEHHILVVFHPIVHNLSTGNLQRAVRHIIDKGAVVTHKHHCPTPCGQQLLQPLNRLNVQVVGRLVEQQHIRAAQQNFRQLDTHAPAT